MIVAIEGASAAGKTTWCRTHAPHTHVPEPQEDIAAPDLFADPSNVARFWVTRAVERWQSALNIEREHGVAICDGDPLKLYYSWALWKCGVLSSQLFDIESGLYTEVIAKQQIGFVDAVLWLETPIDELRRRKQADSTRRRRRHEMHLSLVPWMKVWFEARERVLPATVSTLKIDHRLEAIPASSSQRRYDPGVLRELTVSLASLAASH